MKRVEEIEKELAGIEDELMDVDYRKPKNQIQTLIDRKRELERDLERALSKAPGIEDVSAAIIGDTVSEPDNREFKIKDGRTKSIVQL